MEALVLIQDIPPDHRLSEARFGSYADSIGGGHYVELSITYALGNVNQGPVSDKRTAHRRLIRMVVAAWEKEVAADQARV